MTKKMLIVDDEELNREILQTIFENKFKIMQVESGEKALEVITDFMPDVILLDVMMGGIDGFETCKRIRKNPKFASVLIVIVSAKALESDQQMGLYSGANYYITKPFSIHDIEQQITEMIDLAP